MGFIFGAFFLHLSCVLVDSLCCNAVKDVGTPPCPINSPKAAVVSQPKAHDHRTVCWWRRRRGRPSPQGQTFIKWGHQVDILWCMLGGFNGFTPLFCGYQSLAPISLQPSNGSKFLFFLFYKYFLFLFYFHLNSK